MRLKEKRLASGLKAKALGRAVGLDESMISRFENYRCLPTPPDMERLCRELGCTVRDLYDPAEIRYAAPPRAGDAPCVYRLTVDLPPEARERVREAVKLLGYANMTAWIEDCYVKLMRRMQKRKGKGPAGAEPKKEREGPEEKPPVSSLYDAGARTSPPKGEKNGTAANV